MWVIQRQCKPILSLLTSTTGFFEAIFAAKRSGAQRSEAKRSEAKPFKRAPSAQREVRANHP